MLSSVRMLLAPPVRVRNDGRNQEISPDEVENWFVEHGYTDDIQDNYLDDYYEMLARINQWVVRNLRAAYQEADFDCSIMRCCINIHSNELWLDVIFTRPCAQGWGFYRHFLWRLRCCVIRHNMVGLYVFQANDYNAGLLRRLGFTSVSEGELKDGSNYWMPFEDLRFVLAGDWKVPRKFPSADKLNRPEDVNGGRELGARLKGLYL